MAQLFLKLSTTILLFVYLPITMATDESLVLDADGNPLEVGSAYYIRTEASKVGIGGGIVVASKPNQPKCPQYVGQLSVGWYQESPIMLDPSDPSQKYVHVSSNLNIVFNSTSSACPQGAWELAPDANSGKVLITTGGDIRNTRTDNLFKIENDVITGFYYIAYCPTSSTNNIMCGVISTIDFTEDFPLGWLGLAPARDSYFAVLSFIKA